MHFPTLCDPAPIDAPSVGTDYDSAVVNESMKEMCSLCSYGSGVEMPCHSKNNWFNVLILKHIAMFCTLKCSIIQT